VTRILIIKHGALGDLIQALGPCAAIRRHHPDAHITLLTTPAFVAFLTPAPYFDRIEVDDRPSWTRPFAWLTLVRWLRREKFDRVYDLQTSRRSSQYFQLMRDPKPEWSGIAVGCSHPDPDPGRETAHTVDRQAGQLRSAGIPETPPSDLSWVSASLEDFALPERYALLVPGGSAHRPAKRWPAFAGLANRLMEAQITPVLLGTSAEAAVTAGVARAAPGVIDLTGRTNLAQIAALGRGAALAVGNDTGPMHILAVAGAPSLVLFSAESDPARCAPRSPRTRTLRMPDLKDLSIDAVWSDALALLA
jgi:ADP-heptose:LPS heptosyltransferase